MSVEIVGGAFVSSVVSGVIPLVNGEAVAIVSSLAVEPWARLPLLVACVTGHLLSKFTLFWIASRSPERLPAKARALAERFDLARAPRASSLVVVSSALVAIPPLYPTTLAAGLLGMPLLHFLVGATVGMVCRFGVLIWGAGYFAG